MSDSWIGRTLNGRYHIEELLGQGGMSAVYRATDPNLQRVVAVKIIHSHLSDSADFMRRFEAEAAAVARMRHNNIIQVYDFDHENNTYFIVFEYIPGETLQAWLSRLNKEKRLLPIADAVRIAASIAEALEFAHQQELIHRDIKPANVMINVKGEPILMDFGIAKIVGGTQHTATGAVIGTARYMSPEQIKGERVDARTDLYSLGVTLFEMLSGRPPYESDSVMTMMMMHVQDPVPNLLELRPDVPAAIVAIIYRALSKEPAERYATAAEMASALRDVLGSLENNNAAMPAAAPAETVLETATAATTPAASPPSVTTPQAVTTSATPPASASTGNNSPERAAPEKEALKKWGMIGGAVIGLLLLVLLGYNLLMGADDADRSDAPDEVAVAETLQASVVLTVAAAEAETAVTLADAETPTATPTPEPSPTATPLPEVTITNITLVNDVYVVQYNTIGFEESLPGMHVHFFFDTTPPQEAGRPFSNFFMYGGPSPYTDLRLSDRPQEALQLCALVANPDHTVQGESGNCFDLPLTDQEAAADPPRTTVDAAIVAEPPTPTATAMPMATPTPAVQISDIREENGTYIVTYTTTGFTEQLPGVHIHFFFDTVAPENAGLPHSGPWFVWGGPRPFDGYQTSDRPAAAQRMCALVANTDHSIRLGTGNCVYLPDANP
jgi:serine/threonine protein kinase